MIAPGNEEEFSVGLDEIYDVSPARPHTHTRARSGRSEIKLKTTKSCDNHRVILHVRITFGDVISLGNFTVKRQTGGAVDVN